MPKQPPFSLFLTTLLALSAPVAAFESVQLKKSFSVPEGQSSYLPSAVAADRTGRFWVSDPATHQVLAYSAAGELQQRLGKLGSALGEFQDPHGLAVDRLGNLFVADRGNHRVQVFGPEGNVRLAFGEKGSEPGELHDPWSIAVSGDGVVFVSEKDGTRVQLFSHDGIFLRSLEIGTPIDGIAVDAAGRLYTSHSKLRLIEQWSAAGQLLRTFAGQEPGVKGLAKPTALAVSDTGLLYIGDPGQNQFREMDAGGHTLGVFGRSGSGEGQFKSLDGIAVANETVWVCDARNKRVIQLSLKRSNNLSPLTPVPASRLQVNRQPGLQGEADRLAWNPNGTLHALSFARNEVVTYELPGGSTTQMDLKALAIQSPSGIATAPSSGALFISDSGDDRIVKLDRQGKVLLEIGKSSAFFKSGQGELSKPQGTACSPQGVLFVANSGNGRFDAFNHQGLFQFSGGEKGTGPGQLKNPVSVAWDKERIFVADAGNHKVVAYSTAGRFLRETGVLGPETLTDPRQVAIDREGNMFVLDVARGRVVAYDAQGVYLGGFGSPGRSVGSLNRPKGFALNDNGDLYIAEEGRIQGFHVVLLPPAPTGLTGMAGEGYVTLKWEPVKTRYPAQYLVYRSTPSGDIQKIKETVETTAVDDTLVGDSTYTYVVVAQSVQGASSVPSAPVSLTAKALASGPRLEIVSAKIDDVFSAHYKYYGRVPLGQVTIRNNGLPPARKIRVSFAIQGYMDYPTEVAIPELHSGEQKEVNLLATFNNRILEVTETTPIQAQVKLVYYNGDQEATFTKNLPFKLYSRNTIRWDNKGAFSAFVTPNDPPVIDFARGLAVPFLESHRASPVPSAISTAWAIFEGLGTYGITYVPRPNNPYDRVSLDSSTVDSLQFARETLSRKSGDCADVVALYASALESLTVATVALDAPGHLFVMFDTGESEKDALGFPEGWVVPYAGTYWVPVEVTMLGSPFLDAWKQGAEQYRRWSQQHTLTPVDIHLGWKTFEPATLPDVALGVKPPTRETVEEKFIGDWKALVNLRWQTTMTQAKAAATADPKAGAPWMRMGFVAVDFKKFEEAKQYFTHALQDPSTAGSAYNNLGNIAFISGDTALAESQYQQALQKEPNDPQISLNLARVYLKSGHPAKAAKAYDRAVSLDNSLRDQFPDVSSLGQ